jgi:hypothetical protein
VRVRLRRSSALAFVHGGRVSRRAVGWAHARATKNTNILTRARVRIGHCSSTGLPCLSLFHNRSFLAHPGALYAVFTCVYDIVE